MPPPIESPFEKLLVKLVRDGVVFTTVGGVAVCLNGYIRLTDDVDLLVEPSPGNIARLLESLAGFGEGHARELTMDDFRDEEGAIRVIEAGENCQVDLFTRMGGLHWRDLQAHVLHFETQGARIPHLDAAGLIRLKERSKREKDILDVAVLRKLRGRDRL
jgi:hypothetical protein